MDAIVAGIPLPGPAGLDMYIRQMERANASMVFRQWLAAERGAPDTLTRDALQHAADQKWLGNFSCSGDREVWVSSIYFAKWEAVWKDGMAYRRVTLTSQLSLL
jgi:hypothetical protein